MSIAVQHQTLDAKRPDHQRVASLEQSMLDSGAPVVDLPLIHRFTPGLYAREIFMPANTVVTSKIHKTEHPFVVLSGRVRVFIFDDESEPRVEILEAPHVGVTKPGTRRVLLIEEDTRWITFHPTVDGEDGEDALEKIEARIIEQPLLGDGSRVYDRYIEAMRRQLSKEKEVA